MKTLLTAPLAALAGTLLIFIGGCSRQSGPATQITGIVQYQLPVELEPGATLELRLTDVSGDGAAEVAKVTVADLEALPYQYALPYDAGKIDGDRRYTVDARIKFGEAVRFSTDTAYAVLTQGNGATRNITVVAIGEDSATQGSGLSTAPGADMLQGELRRDKEITLYKAGMQDGHVLWLEEDRSNGTPQTLHARYEFKGALIMRYADTSPLEVSFDERGRATGIVKNGRTQPLQEQTDTLNGVRNRAELLRSHALAVREAQAHRQATDGL